jgi:hypothetical protein
LLLYGETLLGVKENRTDRYLCSKNPVNHV